VSFSPFAVFCSCSRRISLFVNSSNARCESAQTVSQKRYLPICTTAPYGRTITFPQYLHFIDFPFFNVLFSFSSPVFSTTTFDVVVNQPFRVFVKFPIVAVVFDTSCVSIQRTSEGVYDLVLCVFLEVKHFLFHNSVLLKVYSTLPASKSKAKSMTNCGQFPVFTKWSKAFRLLVGCFRTSP
jgi:hypothetical protein